MPPRPLRPPPREDPGGHRYGQPPGRRIDPSLPIAVAAVSGDVLDKAGSSTFLDLTRFTPSLSITRAAAAINKFDMDGLSTGAYRTSDTSDRTLVAVYLGDTPISVRGETPYLRVYDLERRANAFFG